MISSNLLGILSAITSALVWGSGDFSGGFAARRWHSLQVLVLSALSGIGVLILGAFVLQEGFPAVGSSLWAAAAGAAGTLGVAAIYRALGQENAANIAPVSAVIGAGLPVAFGLLTEGAAEPLRLAGFGLDYPGAADVPCGGLVTGLGKIHGNWTMIVANDSRVKAGTYFPITLKKHMRAQAIAERCGLNCVYIADSGGAYLPLQADVFPDDQHFGSMFYNMARMSAQGLKQITLSTGGNTARVRHAGRCWPEAGVRRNHRG